MCAYDPMILCGEGCFIIKFQTEALSLKMIQKEFADKVVAIVKKDPGVIGLAAGGSWISNELDEYSDLDLVLVTQNKIAGNEEKMIVYAKGLGNFISGFTGEHVGEPRLLVCLYDD